MKQLKKNFGLKKKTFWAEYNIFGLNHKRIKQKKEEERVVELKQKRLG